MKQMFSNATVRWTEAEIALGLDRLVALMGTKDAT